ncbi:MAG TPA: transcription elongation factor GreB [Oligoflexia bacterium]|nr:transcription elongation factor GreB [Oligoflexia bacterium]HMP49655.1 transcription elongation factor GreB [Oligoflexia bacterium]
MRYAHGTPPGEKNYITPSGLERLRTEFQFLKYDERPKIVETVSWAAGNGDRSENGDYIYGKKRLREIDKRLQFLSQRIDAAEVVDPLLVKLDYVAFGATVTVEDEDACKKVYIVVGADEASPENGRISWVSPIARGMLKARVGDFITYSSPSGEKGLEILKIEYLEIP